MAREDIKSNLIDQTQKQKRQNISFSETACIKSKELNISLSFQKYRFIGC